MSNDDNSDTASSGELPKITGDASGGTDNNHGDRQQKVNQESSSQSCQTTAFHCQCPICQRHHLDDPAHAPSAPTDANKQTQNRPPSVLDVVSTSGSASAKRPRTGTTSHKFCGSAHCDAPRHRRLLRCIPRYIHSPHILCQSHRCRPENTRNSR
jgi:hypothetical protein